MNPLLSRIAVVRRRYQIVTFFSGVFAVAAFVIGAATLVGLFDYANHLPRLFRAGALVGLLAGAGGIFYRYLAFPLARRSDNLSLALRIEERHPELNDSLASAIQFLESPDAPTAGDALMRDKAIQRAATQAASFDFNAILDYRFLALAAAGFVAAIAAAGHFVYHEPGLSGVAVLRLADPFGHHPWTAIGVPDAATRIAVGQPFRLKAAVSGVIPKNLKIEMQVKNPFTGKFESRPDVLQPVKIDPNKRSGSIVTPLDVSQKPLEFRYRISGNDGQFPPYRGQWHSVQVLQPPSFAELDRQPSPQITLHIPTYTGLPSPVKLSPGNRHLDVIQGTVADFRAAVDRPIKSATIEIRPIDVNVRLASVAGLVAPPTFLAQAAPTAFLNSFSWFQPVTLDESRTKLSAKFRPWITGSYSVHLVDDNGLSRTYEAEMRVAIDPLPVVQLKRPAVSQSYLPTADVPVLLFAEDDTFAVKAAFLEYRRKSAQGDWIDTAPKRILLFSPTQVGQSLRALTRSAIPFEALVPLRPKRLELSMMWNLKNQFKIGDILSVQGAADDFCDVFTPRLAGRSHEIEIRIVGEGDLARQLDEDVAQVQQELLALKKMEDDAQKLLDQIPKDRDDPKANAKALDDAIEAAQKVKQVQERIGVRGDEGLRDKLEKMQQTIKDNKLPDSDVNDQIKNVAQELERLVQEDFPKLEQDLSDLRKELSGGQKSKDEKKKSSPLDSSKKSNEEIQKTIGDLTKTLDRWADLAQIKGQTRDLMDKQKALAEKAEAMKKMADGAPDAKSAKAALADDAKKLAAEQKKLEQEAKDLLDRIAESRKRHNDIAGDEAAKAEDGDADAKQRSEEAKDAAGKLRKAQDTARASELQKDLSGATEELKQGNPSAAKQKQEQAAKTMDRMVKALEGEKDDGIDRLRKKQKDAGAAQNELDKLKKKVDQAQRDQKAGKADLKQQAKDLRDAADQLREQAKQLQRLQEPKAARELQKAAEKLEEAAKQAEAGQDPQEAEQEAQEHIARAEQELEHLQEELAREQLARIGDRLKGLKERQDAAVDRTKELHAKVEAKNRWSRGLVETLEADRQSQIGLARETQSLEEKLKGALVFEHILKKAGKAMEQAGDAMGVRKKEATGRLANDFDAKDKAEEAKRQDETLKLQKLAADRLDRLLEAIKDSPPPQAKREPKERPKDDGGEPKEQPKGGGRPQDGIPPMAQLKALKAEQIEVYERTKEFSRENPNPKNLVEERQRELRELTEEQTRLRQLFEQMTQKKDEGDMP